MLQQRAASGELWLSVKNRGNFLTWENRRDSARRRHRRFKHFPGNVYTRCALDTDFLIRVRAFRFRFRFEPLANCRVSGLKSAPLELNLHRVTRERERKRGRKKYLW